MSSHDKSQSKQTMHIHHSTLDIVAEGKSKRLLEMRKKAMGIMPRNNSDSLPHFIAAGDNTRSLPEGFKPLRKLIEQQLQTLLATFPGNKKKRYFQIRYGISLQQLEQMPITEVATLLKVKPNAVINLKQLNNLDYNGRPINESKE